MSPSQYESRVFFTKQAAQVGICFHGESHLIAVHQRFRDWARLGRVYDDSLETFEVLLREELGLDLGLELTEVIITTRITGQGTICAASVMLAVADQPSERVAVMAETEWQAIRDAVHPAVTRIWPGAAQVTIAHVLIKGGQMSDWATAEVSFSRIGHVKDVHTTIGYGQTRHGAEIDALLNAYRWCRMREILAQAPPDSEAV